jgi:hypothetical protein
MDIDRPPKPRKKRQPWLLVLAVILALAGGGVYLSQWLGGVRGFELIEFTSLYVALPLALSVVLLFAYLRKTSK